MTQCPRRKPPEKRGRELSSHAAAIRHSSDGDLRALIRLAEHTRYYWLMLAGLQSLQSIGAA
jgi:hypothetical protein